jgi:hypothetical protein
MAAFRWPVFVAAVLVLAAGRAPAQEGRHPVPKDHPRIFGSRDDLVRLSRERAEAYRRMAEVARNAQADDHSRVFSLALVAAVEKDAKLGRQAVDLALKYVVGPIKKGHIPFGSDMAIGAVAYDLCFEHWTPEERARFHEYMNKTVDANVTSETTVFHNAWYGYKNWGYGLAGYATYYENPRAPEILRTLEEDYRRRAAPALEMAGAGGGWAEGYYIHYWLYEWLVCCEVARRCEGVDYMALAPKFYRERAVADLFETYPGLSDYKSFRSIPMGDGGGRTFGGDRDKSLSARRILVNRYRDDPAHQAVHAFNERTPRSSIGNYAYKDFLWRDPEAKKGDLSQFKLSHSSPGAGYVYARSSWDDDATCFFFKCGDRFTAHQHLDVGHFLVYKYAELAGDGGHYEDFGTPHDVNYHLRTIAHSTLLVHDPSEKWPRIRAGDVTGNDGGQHHNWKHHNGATADPEDWQRQRESMQTGRMLAFEDRDRYVYVAGDATRAYSPAKLEYFTRQIVYLRPDTFVIFDRVKSTKAEFKKTWLLQAMKKPEGAAPNLVVTHGKGRLFVQTLLPENPQVVLASGESLYSYGGRSYPPSREKGAAPECRIEVSPSRPAEVDYFLHVLTAAEATAASAPPANVRREGEDVVVTVGEAKVRFRTDRVEGSIELEGKKTPLGGAIEGK